MKNVINSEFIKVKHTSYWKLHIFLPVIGALLYIAYFAIYSTVPVLNKENFLYSGNAKATVAGAKKNEIISPPLL